MVIQFPCSALHKEASPPIDMHGGKSVRGNLLNCTFVQYHDKVILVEDTDVDRGETDKCNEVIGHSPNNTERRCHNGRTLQRGSARLNTIEDDESTN